MGVAFSFSVSPRCPATRSATWEKYIARGKASHLGSIEAVDAEAAIETVAKEFTVDAKRLMAVRRG
jgi:hypothetical protein